MTNKRYYWLKLKENFFDGEDIKIISSQKNGDSYIVFWLKLLLKAITSKEVGILRYKDSTPYTPDILSTVTGTNVDIVKEALILFEKLEIIKIDTNGDIIIDEFIQELIGSETSVAERVRKYRNKNKIERHIPYIENYINQKRYGGNYYIVFERDKMQCAFCKSKEKLCIHHIEGYDEKKPENNYDDKLITVCRNCHKKIEEEKILRKEINSYIESVTKCNAHVTKCNAHVTQVKQICNTEKEKEKEKEEEKDQPLAGPAQPGVFEEENIKKDISFDQRDMVQGEKGPARATQPATHTKIKNKNSKMLFDYWNSKENLVKHRNFDTFEDKINTQLKKKHNKDIDNIKKTIDLYNDIMVDDRVFDGHKYKWSITDFLIKGVLKFTDKTIDDFIDKVKINSKRYKSDIERKKFIENCRKGVY